MKTGDPRRNNLRRLNTDPDGTIPTTTTLYHPIESGGDLVTSIQFYWNDAVSNATITLEGTNFMNVDSYANDTRWVTLPITVTGPTATGAGSTLVDISGLGVARLRAKIVTTAVTSIQIACNGKQ